MKKLLFLLLLPSLANAFTYYKNDSQLDINGYVGYQYIYKTAKEDDIKSKIEYGLSLAYKLNDNWSAYTQFAEASYIDNALVYSFVAYDKKLSEDFELNIKGGKLRHGFALYNDIRLNPRTRPYIIMPQAIYWDALKYFLVSGDGINPNLKYKNWEFSYTIDSPEIQNPEHEAKVWSGVMQNSVSGGFGAHQLATIKYTFDEIPLILKASWMYVNLGNHKTAFADILYPQFKGKPLEHEIITPGAILNLGKTTLSFESLLFKPFYAEWGQTNKLSWGHSFTVKYELTEKIDIYSNYNYYHTNTPPKYSWFANTHDASIGARYHEKNWQVGIETHYVNGGRWVDPDNFQANPSDYKSWMMIGANFTYFF